MANFRRWRLASGSGKTFCSFFLHSRTPPSQSSSWAATSNFLPVKVPSFLPLQNSSTSAGNSTSVLASFSSSPKLLPMLVSPYKDYSFGYDEVECSFFVLSRGSRVRKMSRYRFKGGISEVYCVKKAEGGDQFSAKILVPGDIKIVCRCVGSSHCWLALLCPHRNTLFLSSFPLTVASQNPHRWSSTTTTPDDQPSSSCSIPCLTIPLPIMDSLPHIKSVVLGANHPIYLRKAPRLQYSEKPAAAATDDDDDSIRVQYSDFVHKMVWSAPPSLDGNSCSVMAILGGPMHGDIAFCQLHGATTDWILLNEPSKYRFYEDIMYSERDKRFYALNWALELEAWDLRDPCCPIKTTVPVKIPLLSAIPDGFAHCKKRYHLVESLGQILVVRRHIASHIEEENEDDHNYQDESTSSESGVDSKDAYKSWKKLHFGTVFCEVLRLDTKRNQWKLVRDLGDGVLFVGLNQSVSMSATELPHQLTPNSIYFAEDNYKFMRRPSDGNVTGYPVKYKYREGGHDFGFFDLKSEEVTRLKWDYLQSPVWAIPNLSES